MLYYYTPIKSLITYSCWMLSVYCFVPFFFTVKKKCLKMILRLSLRVRNNYFDGYHIAKYLCSPSLFLSLSSPYSFFHFIYLFVLRYRASIIMIVHSTPVWTDNNKNAHGICLPILFIHGIKIIVTTITIFMILLRVQSRKEEEAER